MRKTLLREMQQAPTSQPELGERRPSSGTYERAEREDDAERAESEQQQ